MRKKEKQQDNLCKENEAKAQKLAFIAKVKEKKEKEKKATQKAILELENAQKTASKLQKRERKKQDNMFCKVCAAELSGINLQVFP